MSARRQRPPAVRPAPLYYSPVNPSLGSPDAYALQHFDRYNIVDGRDVRLAAAKLEQYF